MVDDCLLQPGTIVSGGVEIQRVTSMTSEAYRVVAVGGGIVGLATALALEERLPDLSLAVLEKEAAVARHQTGHNSGVVHAGIYYRPGSYKARLCVDGDRMLEDFCRREDIRFDRCGKLIVAADVAELPRLQLLYERGTANGVAGLEMVGPERARDRAPRPGRARPPFARDGDRGLRRGGRGHGAAPRAQGSRDSDGRRGTFHTAPLFRPETGRGILAAHNLVNCAGLHGDRIARMMGLDPGALVVPFRGEYYSLRAGCGLVRGLIYPVHDPEFPFPGVHFARRIQAGFEAGPDAVLAWAREGYRRRDVDVRDIAEMLAFAGFRRMGGGYRRTGLYEWYRSLSRRALLRSLQRPVPDLAGGDLVPGGSGVRAQLVMRDGALRDDFHILQSTPNAASVTPFRSSVRRIGGCLAEVYLKKNRAHSALTFPGRVAILNIALRFPTGR